MAFPTPIEVDVQPYSGAGYPTTTLAAVGAGDVLIAIVGRRGPFTTATALTPSLSPAGADRPFTAFGAQVNTPDATISALVIGYRIATGDEESLDWDQYSQQHVTLIQLPSTADPTTATVLRMDDQSANSVCSIGTFDAAGHFAVAAWLFDRDSDSGDHWTYGAGWAGQHSDASDGGRPYVKYATATPSSSIEALVTGSISVGWAGFAVEFAAAADPLPDCDSPLWFDVYDLGDADTPGLNYLATLCDAFDKSIRIELDGTGSGKFSINRSSLDATEAILGDGDGAVRYIQVRIPGITGWDVPRFGFFINSGDFRLLDEDEDGGETLTFSGPGSLAYLDFAVMAAHSYIRIANGDPIDGDDPFGGLWRLYAAGTGTKPGQILRRVIAEAEATLRPQAPLPLLTYAFDYTDDSDSNTWASSDATDEMAAQIGESKLSVAGRLVGTGVLTLQMAPDFELGAYNSFGTDRSNATFASNKIRFVGGTNIAEGLTRQVRPSRVATQVIVYGEEEVSVVSELADAADRVTREGYLSAVGKIEATLEAIGDAELAERQLRSESLSLRIKLGDDDAAGLYHPWDDFWVGDTVTLHTGTGEFDYENVAFPIAAINIIESNAVATVDDLEVVVELASTRIGEGSSGGGGISGSPGGGSGVVPAHTHPSSLTGAELNRHGGQDVQQDHGSMGATETFDPANGNVHIGTLNANCTFTITNPVGAGTATLILAITGSGTRTWTWPGSVTWLAGTAPDPPADTETVVVSLTSFDGGPNWIGGPWGGSPALDPDDVKDAGRWEHAVIAGSPPDDLYADGDWLYIWVPGP